MPRPAFTEASFLGYIFKPSKHAKPLGLRHRKLAGKKVHKRSRVNAYNRLPAEKQAVIDRSGLREEYLKGEVTYTDARRVLRDTAVQKGIVKPVRQRGPIVLKATRLDHAVIVHMQQEGLDVDLPDTLKRLQKIPDSVKPEVIKADRGTIRRRAQRRPYVIGLDNEQYNPYWYH